MVEDVKLCLFTQVVLGLNLEFESFLCKCYADFTASSSEVEDL